MTLSIPPRTEAPVGPKTAITPQPLIQQLQTSGPGWLRIGESVEQRPIEAMLLGNGDRRVLLIGGIHGDEPEGLTVMEWFAEELLSDASLRRGSKVLIVRNLNPDGTAANTRTNKHGVDLNRNFPATNWEATARNARFNPGSEPASEPETRLAVQLLREFGPHRILVMHATSGRPMNNYDGPGKELARQLSQFNRYMVSDTIGYATPGSLGSYAGIDLQIPIITLELPRKIDADRAWEANKGALRQMLIWDEQL